MLKQLILVCSVSAVWCSWLGASERMDHIHQTTLQNGLDVIVIENATVPLATVEIDVRNGAFTEPPELDGLSHLFEHMFFKANASIPNQERFLERTRELGITFNATTTEERVNYSFTVLADSLRPTLKLMKAAVATPLFLEEELQRERYVVMDEYHRNEAEPFFHLNRAVDKKVWYKFFSRKDVIGDPQVILSVTRAKMLEIQRKYYIPNNCALLVAGAVKHDEVFALVQDFYSDWPKGPAPFAKDLFSENTIPYPPPLTRNETVIVEQPVNSVTILLRWQGPSVSIHTKDTYVADVFNFIMNQNSKFPSILVGSGLFTSVSFSYLTLDQKGPITIVAQTTAEKFLEARSALFEEMKYLISADYFSDEQLEFAKNNLEARQEYDWERPSAYVQAVGFWWSITGGLDYYASYIENIKKVTRADIAAFVKKYIQNAPHVMGIMLSPQDRKKLGL